MNNPYYDVTEVVVYPDDSFVKCWYATQATTEHCAIQYEHWLVEYGECWSRIYKQNLFPQHRIDLDLIDKQLDLLEREIDYRRFGELLPSCD